MKKTEFLAFKVRPSVKAHISKIAEIEDKSKSQVIRECLYRGLEKKSKKNGS